MGLLVNDGAARKPRLCKADDFIALLCTEHKAEQAHKTADALVTARTGSTTGAVMRPRCTDQLVSSLAKDVCSTHQVAI